MELVVRSLACEDILQAYEIEKENFESPWDYDSFVNSCNSGYNYVIADEDDIVYGFILISRVIDECEILNFAVKKTYHSQGLGTKLLDESIGFQPDVIKDVWLEVKESNSKAQDLYLKYGFTKCGIRKRYYKTADGFEDAIVMKYRR